MAAKRKAKEKEPPVTSKDSVTELSELDTLIKNCYEELVVSIKGKAKLGDLIKMIELRRKLAPSDSAQKEFWKMLEQIRAEKLPAGNSPGSNPRTLETKPDDKEK